MKMKKTIIVLMAIAMLLSSATLVGCHQETDPTGGSVSESETTTTSAGIEWAYNRQPENFNRFEMDILNVEKDLWNMQTALAPTEYGSDVVQQAVFERNDYIEQEYNCVIVEHSDIPFYSMSTHLLEMNLAGTNPYDAAYIEGQRSGTVIAESAVQNLYAIPELQLDESWWSQLVKEECTVGKGRYETLYFAQSNLSLVPFELTWCIYFNKAQASALDFDFYSMVGDNTWTLETMLTKAKASAALNGDEFYTYDPNGKSIYGFTTYWNGIKALLTGCNAKMIERNDDGDPYYALTDATKKESFILICQKIAELCGTDGAYAKTGQTDASSYLKIFESNRAMFLGAEVKSSVSDLKDCADFGILPYPKADESAPYRSWINYLATVLVIPSSVKGDDLHKTATLLDAMSFYSDKMVIPEYYDRVLQYRGAKDQESIDMLDRINKTRVFESGLAYGWTGDLIENICTNHLMLGIDAVGGLIDSDADSIGIKIEKTLKSYN